MDLAFERVVNALTLVDCVAQILRARDRLHCNVGAQRHALMHMSSRWQRISSLLLRIVVSVRSRVLALVDTFLARLLHWWQLQLLVVEIVRFFASVSLSVAGNFLF